MRKKETKMKIFLDLETKYLLFLIGLALIWKPLAIIALIIYFFIFKEPKEE